MIPCLAMLTCTVALAQQATTRHQRSGQNAAASGRISRAAPAQPAQPQQADASVETPRLIYSPWVKFCPKPRGHEAKTICYTAMDSTSEAGSPMASAVLIETEGEPEKTFRLSLPNALQLQPGIRIIIDRNAPVNIPFYTCLANGCIADLRATPRLIEQLKKGQTLVIQAYRITGITGTVISVAMPLVDFAKANDGPPIDPNELETRQKQREELLLKKAEDAQKKSEDTSPPAQAPDGK